MIFFIGALLILFLIIGIRDLKHKNLKSYTIGDGDKFSAKEIVGTVFATAIGSGATVGAVSMVYKEGLLYAIPKLLTFIYWLILAKIFATKIWKFRGCYSLSDIMFKLYGKFAKYITSVGTAIVAIGTVSAQITAAGYLFEYFDVLSFHKSIILIFLVMTLYTALGGIKSVIKTDFIQMCIFGITLPIAYGAIYREVDSAQLITQQIQGIDNITNNMSKFLGLLFLFIFPGISAPYIQRMLIIKERAKNIMIFYWVAFFVFLLNVFIIVISLTIKAKNPSLPANHELYFFIKNYLSKELSVLIVLSIISVILSTADSWLNTASTMLSKDFLITISYRYFKISHIFVVRVTTIILGIIALIISMKSKLILEVIWFVKNFWSPVILVPLITGFIGSSNKNLSFLHGFIGGVIGVVVGFVIYKKLGLESLMIGVICNALGFFGVKLIWNKIKKYVQTISEYNLKDAISKIKQYQIGTRNHQKYRFFLLLNGLFNIPILIYSIYSNSIASICISIALQIMLIISYSYNYDKLYKTINFSSYIFLNYFCFHYCSFQTTWVISVVLMVYVIFLIRESAIEFFISSILLISINIMISLLYYGRFHVSAPQYLELYITGCCLLYLAAAIYWNIREIKEANFLMQASLHDSGNAINSAKNSVFLLREDNKKNKKILEIADHILISLGKSQNICKFPLMLSKIGHNTFLKEEIDLKKVMNDSIAYYSKVNQEDIKINVDLVDVNARVVANHELLCRVIGIILNNAVDAFDKTGEKKIIITSQVRENKLELVIEDNGRGIKKDDISCIFNHGMSTKKNGFGIGLSFVKFALYKMDIAIQCKSAYRKGTTFILMFNL